MYTQKMSYVFLFFILLVLVPSPAFASDNIPTSHFTAKIHVKAFDIGSSWDIHLGMYVTTIDQATLNGTEANMSAKFYVNDIPTKVWKGSDPGYILKKAYAELRIEGTNSYIVADDTKTKPSDGWGDIATISLNKAAPLIQENRSGIYYWRLHMHLYYEHLVGSVVTDTYTIDYNLIPDFHDFSIVSFHIYKNESVWSQVSRGAILALSQIWNVWVVTESKISNTNWPSLSSLDILGFLKGIESILVYIGYGILRTFTAPISTISLIMGQLKSAIVLSFFVISLVAVSILAIGIFIGIWKLIIFIKP